MAQALRAGLRNGGLRRGGFRPGLGNGSLFAIAPLDMFFARTRTLDSRVTFTRASSGTYVGSDRVLRTATTNEPRFNHNPTTGASLGLLVEEQRTNLLLRSEELDNASWSRVGLSSVTANATAAPDGNVTAESLVETTGVSEVHRILQTISVTSGTTYSASAYFKQEGRRYGFIALGPNATWNSLGASAFIDLQTGTAQSITNCTAVVQALPGSWYRLTITATPTATNASASMTLGISSTGSTQTYTGDGRTAISVWGAQLEAGAFASSYIPTTTAAATRSADVASITGTNFSSWYNQTQGTLYAKSAGITTRAFSGASFGIASLNDGTGNNENRLRYRTAGSTGAIVLVSNVIQFDSSPTGVLTAPGAASLAVAYAASNFGSAGNGGTPTQGSSGTVPTVSQLQIGADSGGYLNGTISRLSFWPSRLPNSTLQAITQ